MGDRFATGEATSAQQTRERSSIDTDETQFSVYFHNRLPLQRFYTRPRLSAFIRVTFLPSFQHTWGETHSHRPPTILAMNGFAGKAEDDMTGQFATEPCCSTHTRTHRLRVSFRHRAIQRQRRRRQRQQWQRRRRCQQQQQQQQQRRRRRRQQQQQQQQQQQRRQQQH